MGSSTPNLGLYKPDLGEVGYDDEFAASFDVLDARVSELGYNVLDFGAAGDGSTDDTAAFDAAADAAGQGGRIYAPPGYSFVLDDWEPNQQVHIIGGGLPTPGVPGGGTTIKAAVGAEYALRLVGRYHVSVKNLMIDGRDAASGGIYVAGSDTTSAQGFFCDRVEFYRCLVGVKLDTSVVTQVDKNSFRDCRWDECTTGLWLNSTNADLTLLTQCTFTSAETAIRVTGGELVMIVGAFGTNETNLKFDGTQIFQVTLIGVNSEKASGTMLDIDGSTHWPIRGVHMQGCSWGGEADGSITQGVYGVLSARQTTFGGDILVTAGSGVFFDELCAFPTGVTWTPSASSGAQRMSWFPIVAGVQQSTITHTGGTNGDQVAWSYNANLGGGTASDLRPGMSFKDVNLYQGAANVLKTDDKFTITTARDATFSTNPYVVLLESTDANGAGVGPGVAFGAVYTGSTRTVVAAISGVKANGTGGNYDGLLKFGVRANGSGATDMTRATLDATGKLFVSGEVEIDGALNHDGATVGFYGQTPASQPAANADTSGATLGQLETEVNELKAALRSLGLIAT